MERQRSAGAFFHQAKATLATNAKTGLPLQAGPQK